MATITAFGYINPLECWPPGQCSGRSVMALAFILSLRCSYLTCMSVNLLLGLTLQYTCMDVGKRGPTLLPHLAVQRSPSPSLLREAFFPRVARPCAGPARREPHACVCHDVDLPGSSVHLYAQSECKRPRLHACQNAELNCSQATAAMQMPGPGGVMMGVSLLFRPRCDVVLTV